jgi:hypothetical protein
MDIVMVALKAAGFNLDPRQDYREIYTEFMAVLNKHTSFAPTSFAPTSFAPTSFAPTSFAPTSFAPLTPPLDYPALEQLAFQLTLQLQVMEAHGFTLLFWQPSDILQINSTQMNNETIYLLANLSQMVPLHEKDPTQLVLVYPTVYPLPAAYCAPELLKMAALPFRTHRSASYYSLALLCLRLGQLSLAKLEGTKLFYFLERCLKAEPSERMLLYF